MGILNETARTIPKSDVFRVGGGVAVACAVIAFAFAAFLSPGLGIVVAYVVVPLLVAIAGGALAAITRLRLVGFLPGLSERLIPPVLKPWLRFWLLARFGLLGSWLLLVVVIGVAAVLHRAIQYFVEAFVYVVMARMFMDLLFGTVLNVGIITRRNITA